MYHMHLFVVVNLPGNIPVIRLVSYSFTSKSVYFDEMPMQLNQSQWNIFWQCKLLLLRFLSEYNYWQRKQRVLSIWQKNSSLIFIIPCVKWNCIFQNVQKRGQAHKLHENPNFWEFPTKNFCFIWFSSQHFQTSVELVNAFQNLINFHIFHNFLKKFLSAPFVPIKKLKAFKCYTNLDVLWLSWTSIVSILALFKTEYDAALKLKALSSIDRKLELNNETGLSLQQMTMYHYDLIHPPPFDKPLHLFSFKSIKFYLYTRDSGVHTVLVRMCMHVKINNLCK